jgi:hypothetical protein
VAGVGKDVGGDSCQPPPATVMLGIRPHVRAHMQVGPPPCLPTSGEALASR